MVLVWKDKMVLLLSEAYWCRCQAEYLVDLLMVAVNCQVAGSSPTRGINSILL
jgi:hypothetical protein